MSKPFFHEATDEEVKALIEGGKSWQDVMQTYRQPEWCDYPDALSGVMGCWSLTDIPEEGGKRIRVSKDFCKGCECFNSAI